MEAIFYTLVALLGVKLHKISSHTVRFSSETDLLGNPKEESGYEQLNRIKNIKKNISLELINHYLPGKKM